MNKVSFIIRTLNEGLHLESVLESISKQNYSNYEVLIVDSGSEDDTLEIANAYQCKIINISASNWSWGRSLNLGIQNSCGDYICVISGHCILTDPEFINNACDALQRVDVAYGSQEPIHGLDPFEEYELKQWYPDRSIPNNDELVLAGKGVGVSNACAIFKKTVWEVIKFDEDLQSMEDADWAFRAATLGSTIAYSSDFSVYHSHPLDVSYIYRKWYCRQYEGYSFFNKRLSLYPTNMIGVFRFKLSSLYRFSRSPIDAISLLRYLKRKGYEVQYSHALCYFLIRNVAAHVAYNDYQSRKEVSYWKVSPKKIDLLCRFFGFDKIQHEVTNKK
jgi:glycosyltransferase involved in cell wall biosynthesis